MFGQNPEERTCTEKSSFFRSVKIAVEDGDNAIRSAVEVGVESAVEVGVKSAVEVGVNAESVDEVGRVDR